MGSVLMTSTAKVVIMLAGAFVVGSLLAVALVLVLPSQANTHECRTDTEKERYCRSIPQYLNLLDTKDKIKGAHGMIVHSLQYCTGGMQPDFIGDAIMSNDDQKLFTQLDVVKDLFK